MGVGSEDAMLENHSGGSPKASNVNRAILIGHLTQDPLLRELPSGSSACAFQILCRTYGWDPFTKQMRPRECVIEVNMVGAPSENATAALAKGKRVALDGSLEWFSRCTLDEEQRQVLGIAAHTVTFLHDQPST
jgi:single-stranded DNA-binding protein